MYDIPIWGWFLGGAALYYLCPIVLIYCTQRFPDEVELLDIDDESLPPTVADQFMHCRTQLRELGFESLGAFVLPKQAPLVTTILEIYADRESCDGAMVTRMFGTQEGRVLNDVHYVEFIRRLRNADFDIVQ